MRHCSDNKVSDTHLRGSGPRTSAVGHPPPRVKRPFFPQGLPSPILSAHSPGPAADTWHSK